MNFNKSTLYIIGVPIGNITDFTQKAIFTIKKVDIIAAETFQKTNILIKFLNINKKKLIIINKLNEISLSYKLINYIKDGKNIAIVSDAGMPLINDPGFFLIKYAYKNNIKINIIPGVSALTAALSASYFDIKTFTFHGFIPKKAENKKIVLETIHLKCTTHIFFESPKRLINTINSIYTNTNKENKLLLIKELTKKFTHIFLADLNYLIIKKNLINNFTKGELTLILNKNYNTYIYKKHTKIIKNNIFTSFNKNKLF